MSPLEHAPDTAAGARANERLADRLREAAQLLEGQSANPFRVRAYRAAADELERLPGDVRAIFEAGGLDALDALPGIGRGIAAAIAEMLLSGRWMQLERLRGTADPVALLRVVPGIGPGLAERIHDTLHVDTLQGLEVAAHDGRLAEVPGVGPRRSAAIRAAIGELLNRSRPSARRPAPMADGEPAVALLLEVDREYREKAERGALPAIAPKRFNPEGKAWLPVLHTQRGDWHFTALYSNTARAHELGRTRDWVVLYFYDDAQSERQCTVVTEQRGALAGRRVVRGREAECRAHYGASEAA